MLINGVRSNKTVPFSDIRYLTIDIPIESFAFCVATVSKQLSELAISGLTEGYMIDHLIKPNVQMHTHTLIILL